MKFASLLCLAVSLGMATDLSAHFEVGWFWRKGTGALARRDVFGRKIVDDPEMSKWMSTFAGWRLLDLPIIPGTHHSGINNPQKLGMLGIRVAWSWFKCQYLSVEEQLLYGVRFLDLRVRFLPGSNEIILSHQFMADTSLKQVLQVVKGFLESHESESVILLIRHDTAHKFDAKAAIALATVIEESELTIHGADQNLEGEALVAYHQRSLDLDELYVSELGGKVLIFAEVDSFVPPPGSPESENTDRVVPDEGQIIPYVPHVSRDNLKYRDTWRYETLPAAQAAIETYMSNRLVRQSAVFKGVALDSVFKAVGPIPYWQRRMSPVFNNWFIDLLETKWKKDITKENPLGIVMLDFITPEILAVLLQINQEVLDNTLNEVN